MHYLLNHALFTKPQKLPVFAEACFFLLNHENYLLNHTLISKPCVISLTQMAIHIVQYPKSTAT